MSELCPNLDIVTPSAGTLEMHDGWDPTVAVPVWWMWQEVRGWFDVPVTIETVQLAGAAGQLQAVARPGQPIVVTGFGGVSRVSDYYTGLKYLRTVQEDLAGGTAGTLIWHNPVAEQLDVEKAPGELGEVRVGELKDLGLATRTEVRMGFRFQLSFIAATPGPVAYP